jgi:hypothetical protein
LAVSKKFGTIIDMIAKEIHRIIMANLEKYKKFANLSYENIRGYEKIKDKTFNLFTGQNDYVGNEDIAGELVVAGTLSFAYHRIWGHRRQLFIYKQKGMNPNVIIIDDIVSKLFIGYIIPCECEFLVITPMVFNFKRIIASNIKLRSEIEENKITSDELGNANFNNFHKYMIKESGLFKEGDGIKTIWAKLVNDCANWYKLDMYLWAPCNSELIKSVSVFIKTARNIPGETEEELLISICRTVLELADDKTMHSVLKQLKVMLIRVYFGKYAAGGKVKILLPSDSYLFSLTEKSNETDKAVSGRGIKFSRYTVYS